MDCSTPGFPVLHHLLEFAQTHVHWVNDTIQPSHPLSPTSPPALNLSHHLGLFEWVGSSHQVARVLELQHQSFQWIVRLISFRIVWFDLYTQWWNNVGYIKWEQHGNDRGRCWLRGFDNTYCSSSKEKFLWLLRNMGLDRSSLSQSSDALVSCLPITTPVTNIPYHQVV